MPRLCNGLAPCAIACAAGYNAFPWGVLARRIIKANIENALDGMVGALPPELAAHVVNIPSGQDIVNNGVAVEITLIGIPIIRQIKLYFSYAYAGGAFDPRGLTQTA